MKISILSSVGLLLPLTHAWKARFDWVDNHSYSTSGSITVSGCKNLPSLTTADLNYVYFQPPTDWVPDPTQIRLYRGASCTGSSYVFHGEGYWSPNPRVAIGSFQVL
jgi:hypothetical protein